MIKENTNGCIVNPGKEEYVEWNGKRFACYAVRTGVVTAQDSLPEIIQRYAAPVIRSGDVVFLSEKMVACTEGRAYPKTSIRCGFLARFLCRFVSKSPYGIGLGIPETMQCAVNEAGTARILLACAIGCLGRILHKKGWFYRIAGPKVASIDGPCSCTLPPYDSYVVLSPADPDRTAREISRQLGDENLVLIIDANDLGCQILGVSQETADRKQFAALLRQNPLGQGVQSTPIGILRPVTQK